jgi:mono/diheme cytochrome c family protein
MNRLILHRITGLAATLAGVAALAACTDPGQADPIVRGERIHVVCLSCHGTELYVNPRRRIESLPALRKEVARWGDYYDPALSEQDIDDVTDYLDTAFYKFQENLSDHEQH